MNGKIKLAEAAERALKELGKPSTAQEIHEEIQRLGLFQFGAEDPAHVVETELKRYSSNSPRSDSRANPRFEMNPDKTYTMAKNESSSKRAHSMGMKRIMRSADKEELIEELRSSRVGVFSEIWKLLLFSAQIGLKCGRREPLTSVETGKGIDQATFGNSPAWPGILYLMNLHETGDPQVLSSSPEGEDQRVQLFQEYANGGLSVIKDFFRDRPVDLDGVLALIELHQGHKGGLEAPDLDLSI